MFNFGDIIMDVKEASKKWGCSQSTVRRYCKSGIVPLAEKVGTFKKWDIPDDLDKPPLTRFRLCFLMDSIIQISNNDIDFDKISWGISEEELKNGYDYLIKNMFVSSFDVNNLKDELKKAKLTERGISLIQREIDESKNETKFSAYVKLKGNVGIVGAEIGGEVSNK